MGLFIQRSIIFLCFFSLLYADETLSSAHILYLAQSDKIEEAVKAYRSKAKEEGHDYTLLQNIGYILLARGIENHNLEIQKLTMIGAGMAASSRCLDLLEKGVHSMDISIQMMAIQFLSRLNDDRIDPILIKAMSSYSLPIRFEAAYILASRNHSAAAGQIEALMYRLPSMFKPFFPPLFAMIPTYQAKAVFYDLLSDPNIDVRLEAIHSVGNFSRDDLLPILRKKLSSAPHAEKEATLKVLGKLHDYTCLEQIKKLCISPIENVQLAANAALLSLGQGEVLDKIIALALKKNLFALSLLGDVAGGENLLAKFQEDLDPDVSLNATISLLLRKDPRCYNNLLKIFRVKEGDAAIISKYSPGRSLQSWHYVFSPLQQKDPIDPLVTIRVKEYLLRHTLDLPEETFLSIARTLFYERNNPLIPTLIDLLENVRSAKAIELLKEGSNILGSPLIRNYCNVALFRLGEQEGSKKNMLRWIQQIGTSHIIRISPPTPSQNHSDTSPYDLSSDETTKLLIDTFAALTDEGEDINAFLEAFMSIHPFNRYVFAGYLMKRAE
ncbi:MAG: HEAT repeat domain-containing protein [Parachlamydiales bacterium]|nr:HEAT repeat domain-containing protein [Parachlamydiales bacterium]